MKCENCGEREAAVHLTTIQDNTVSTTHLCEACAADKGIETEQSVAKFPLGDFLASLGKGAAVGASEPGLDVPCRSCGATLRDFRASGRLGCARCYESFEAHLRDLLRRLHGSTVHAGERYAKDKGTQGTGGAGGTEGSGVLEGDAIDGLRDELRRAVEAENFELAARLRDKIRVLE